MPQLKGPTAQSTAQIYRFMSRSGGTYKLRVSEHAAVDPDTRKPTLNVVDCGGGLRTRSMRMTADSSNQVLIFNGRQHRVLNALLGRAL
jgi:hypothetical protein